MRDQDEPYTTTQPLNSTSRRTDIPQRGGNNGWIIGGLAGAALLVGLLFWGMTDDSDRVAETNRPATNAAQTTGSATTTPSQNSRTNATPTQNQSATPPASTGSGTTSPPAAPRTAPNSR